MRRIETKTKGKVTDANGKSFDGFVERDPREGEQSTHLSDSWCNNLQEEICNVIEGVGGQIVSGSDVQVEKYDQMFQAIKLLVDTATPIGSVKAMPIKMSDSYMARWVPIDEDEAGRIFDTGRAAYLSKEMAKNCEKVEGATEGWYKLVTGNKENGEASGAFGWALADGTFPLPISSFGEDDGTRPETEEEKNKREGIISDTEYGKIWEDENGNMTNNKGWNMTRMGLSSNHGTYQQKIPGDYPSVDSGIYFLKEENYIPPKDDTPIDTRTWTENNTKKPKLIPNLNDKTFLMGSNDPNLTVEGKNAFMMQPHHMPPHFHDMSHGHAATSLGAGGHRHDVYDVNERHGGSYYKGFKIGHDGDYLDSYKETGYQSDHTHTINVGYYAGYAYPTGGYTIDARVSGDHNEGGDMEGKHLYGNIPIDLKPKRMTVHYYIRVI